MFERDYHATHPLMECVCKMIERIPAGRWELSDLAGAAVFLPSDASGYVQSHILAVDGGWLAR